ncbi:MAG: hypothetical protein CMP43_02095 [Rickettsiales bacterium]|nr:hypothetical protein [Rickettsiales bacterium]
MPKLLTAILTSEDLPRLERCIKSVIDGRCIPQPDCLVVCNTTNIQFQKDAEKLCAKYPVKFINTESNGKLGKGKNAVLDQFIRTDYDYLFQVDGDDFIYPDAIKTLRKLISRHNEFDVLALTESEVWDGKDLHRINEWITKDKFRSKINEILSKFDSENLMRAVQNCKIGEEITDDKSGLHRVIVWSKKAAEKFRFDESLMVADSPGYLDLKLMHLREELKLELTNAKSIYIYDQTIQTAISSYDLLMDVAKYTWNQEDLGLTTDLFLDIIEIDEKYTYKDRLEYLKKSSKT